MAKKKKKLSQKKKTEKSKPKNGPTIGTDFEVGELKGSADIGLGEASVSIEVSPESPSGATVDIVVGFDVTPLDIDVDYDSTANQLSGSIEVGLPGDLIGITGGVTVNTETGELEAIVGGIDIAGMSITIEKGVGKHSCRTVSTITFFGIGYSVTQDNCKDENNEDENNEEGKNTKAIADERDSRLKDYFLNLPPGAKFVALIASRGNSPSFGSIYYPPSCGESRPTGHGFVHQPYKPLQFDRDRIVSNGENPVLYVKRGNLSQEYPTAYINGTRRENKQYGTDGELYRGGSVYDAPCGAYPWNLYYQHDISNAYPYNKGGSPTGELITIMETGAPRYRVLDIIAWNREGLLPPPPPPPSPRSRPRSQPKPHRKKEENPMNEDCCQAIYQLLIGVANVTGISADYQYPKLVDAKDGPVETLSLIDYLSKQPQLAKLTGYPDPSKTLWPKEILIQSSTTDKNPKKIEVNNFIELLDLIGGSTGYSENKFPIMFTLPEDDRTFTYRSLADICNEFAVILAPHKMLYGNGDNGYAVPNKQIFPGGTGYDFTKDYPGILTRQSAAIERYGFDAPIWIDGEQPESGFEVENLAGAIQYLIKLATENAGDTNINTNLLTRMSYLTIRIYQIVVRIFYRVTAILDGLGINTKNKRTTIPCEFDPLANVNFKGFDSNKPDELPKLDLAENKADTESLLQDYLKPSDLPQSIEEFKGKSLLTLIKESVNKKK